MKKNNIYIVAMLSLLLAIVILCSISVAWLSETNDITPKVDSSIITQYFERGKGTASEPFIIHSKRHLYNLAWLQYYGMFNKVGDDGNIDQYYFELCADEDSCIYINENGENEASIPSGVLDMDGWTLPPIGTNQYPFIGHFEGNGITIKNLNVSGDVADLDDAALELDEFLAGRYSEANNGCDIVGVFGVVGTCTAIDGNFDASAVGIENVIFDSVEVKTNTNTVLVGIAAGFVNAPLKKVGVVNSTVTIGTNASALDETNITSAVSDYALIGYCTDPYIDVIDVNTTTSSIKVVQPLKIGSNESTEGGNNFSRSMNMLEFNKRLKWMWENRTNTSGKTIWDIAKETPPTRIWYNKSSYEGSVLFYSTQKSGLESSTVMKDVTNNRVIFTLGNYSASNVNTFLPINVNDSSSMNYNASDSNTGYIVSNNTSALYCSSYQSVNVYASIGKDNVTTPRTSSSTPEIIDSQVEVLTNNSASYSIDAFVRVNDSFNTNNNIVNDKVKGYRKIKISSQLNSYDSARSELSTIFANSPRFLQGMRFGSKLVSVENKVTAEKVSINGIEYTSYELAANCIDFNVSEPGYITLFAGAYNNSFDTVNYFFSLYSINRSGKTINNINKISTIYKDHQNNYIYGYSDGSASGAIGDAEIVFDMQWLEKQPPVQNAIYYFEIPVGSGEFAIGSNGVSGQVGAYLFYLDIASNASKVGSDEFLTATIETTTHSSVEYKTPLGVELIELSAAADSINSHATATFEIKDGNGKVNYTRVGDIVNTNANGLGERLMYLESPLVTSNGMFANGYIKNYKETVKVTVNNYCNDKQTMFSVIYNRNGGSDLEVFYNKASQTYVIKYPDKLALEIDVGEGFSANIIHTIDGITGTVLYSLTGEATMPELNSLKTISSGDSIILFEMSYDQSNGENELIVSYDKDNLTFSVSQDGGSFSNITSKWAETANDDYKVVWASNLLHQFTKQ